MHLDLPTLMTVGSFVPVCAGTVLLLAWSQNRAVPSLGLWGLAHVVIGCGILCLMLGASRSQPEVLLLGSLLLALGPGLIWKAARSLDGKSASPLVALLGMIAVAVAGEIPVLQHFTSALFIGAGCLYSIATAGSMLLVREERLPARPPLVVLTGLHAIVLALGVYNALASSNGEDVMPPVMSLFGLIHFENIIFSLGTSVFMLALVKERNEAAGMMAARIDPLTGIANRAGFLERAERIVENGRRDGNCVSVMMFDLDRFKVVNDTHGHAVGDAVIRRFCEVTAAALRPGEVFGRLGGEEFAVVSLGTGIEAAHVRADRIRAAFAAGCHFVGGCPVNVTVSCGVACSLGADIALDTLLAESDAALYRAKANGRNRVVRAATPEPGSGMAAVVRVA